MLPDQPFYLSVNELPLKAVVSSHSPDSGIVKFSTTTASRSPSRMVLVHFELKSDASALSGHTASVSGNGKAHHGLPLSMVDITHLLSSSADNQLLIWGQPIPKHVTAHADVVKKVTEEELRYWMYNSSHYVHFWQDFANLAGEQAADRGYPPMHHFQVSLLCPLTERKIRVPGRGARCHHLECFDVFTYLGSNESTLQPSWCCPVCSKQVLVQDIRVDMALLRVIDVATDEDNLVTVQAQLQPRRW